MVDKIVYELKMYIYRIKQTRVVNRDPIKLYFVSILKTRNLEVLNALRVNQGR